VAQAVRTFAVSRTPAPALFAASQHWVARGAGRPGPWGLEDAAALAWSWACSRAERNGAALGIAAAAAEEAMRQLPLHAVRAELVLKLLDGYAHAVHYHEGLMCGVVSWLQGALEAVGGPARFGLAWRWSHRLCALCAWPCARSASAHPPGYPRPTPTPSLLTHDVPRCSPPACLQRSGQPARLAAKLSAAEVASIVWALAMFNHQVCVDGEGGRYTLVDGWVE
jgi:hypothetical protein